MWLELLLVLLTGSAGASFEHHTAPFTIVNGQDHRGFRIKKDLPKGHLLKKLGVREGDVVVAVNSNPIYSIEAAKAAYLKESTHSVTVLRQQSKLLLEKEW